jgi:hypothetical protein
MGAHLSAEQIERLAWIRSRIGFPRIVLFLDRDNAGRDGARQAFEQLQQHNFEVSVFDWDHITPGSVAGIVEPIPDSIKDPADMPVEYLRHLRGQGFI